MGKRKYSGEVSEAKKLKEATVEELPKETESLSHENSFKNRLFDLKHFRKELALKQGQTIALTQFLQVCQNPDSDADYLLEYLKSGGNSHEILRQVHQDNKKNLTLATPAFHLFHLIILKVQSSLPHMIAVTEEACRYFLNNFSSTIEIMISENSGPRHKKIILKLLTSMVTLNPDLGIEVLNQAPLTQKNLQPILEKPNYKEKDNVRTAFVHFMTSFLVEGHLLLIKALLEKQGLLALVIPGLVNDEGEAVLMFLNILKKNIVENPSVSKSLKLKTFSHNVLHQVFKIFYWRGPPESNHETISAYKDEISKLLAELLLILFTSHKLGIYFMDHSLGMTDANKNQNLYKALLTLKRPWENKNQCEVLLQIIYKCPDLHRAVISLIEQSFEPQHSPIWERNVEFVIKLMEKLKPEDMVKRFGKLNSTQVANFIRFTTLPVPILKYVQSSLEKSDQVISLYCIKVLVKMLSSLNRYIQLLSPDQSQDYVIDLKTKLEYFLPKHLPTPLTIVALIDSVIKDTNKDLPSDKEYRLPAIDKVDALISLIDTLLLYSEIHPTYFESIEGTLNIKDILDSSKKFTEGHVAILKFKIVSLWLMLDNTAVSLKNPLFKELFQILLQVYTSDDSLTWMEAKDTLIKFLHTTSIFEADEDEIHIMLYSLRNCKVDTMIIGDIIEYVLTNNSELSDFIRNQMEKFELSDGNTQIKLEKLLDDLMKGTNTDDTSFLEKKIPSSFIVGCMQYCQKNKTAKKNLKEFLNIYIANLLHSNYTPELTELLIGDTKLDVRSYVGEWITKATSLNDTVVGKDGTVKSLSNAIILNNSVELSEVFLFLKESTKDDFDIFVRNSHYKVDSNVDSSDFLIWAKYLIFCTVRLSNMAELQENQIVVIKELFFLLLDATKILLKMDIYQTIITNLFRNPHMVKIFTAIDIKKDISSMLATDFLLEVIRHDNATISHINKKLNIVKAYEQKSNSEIGKALLKVKKRKDANANHAVKVLNTIGLSKEDDILVLNKIFDLAVEDFVLDNKEPSLFLEVFGVIINKYSVTTSLDLTQDILQKIISLYTKLLSFTGVVINLTKLETVLIEYFLDKPYHVKIVTEDNFTKFFSASGNRKTTAQLAGTILTYNLKFCSIFKEQMDRKEILSQRELTLPLGNAILNHNKCLLENKPLLNVIYEEYKSNIFKFINKPHKAGQIYVTNWKFVEKLLLECADLEECETIFRKSHKFEVIELSHIHLLKTILLKIWHETKSDKSMFLENYYLTTLNIITVALKESKGVSSILEVVRDVYIVTQIAKGPEGEIDHKKLLESAIWQNFCKIVLKETLKLKTEINLDSVSGSKLLYLLNTLVKQLYPDNHNDIPTLFDMVTSHSEFLKVMLSHSSEEIKSRLVEILFTLLSKNKSVMKPQQIPVYLSSYHATTSPCDRLLLKIIHFYEINEISLFEYKPYLWGDLAANHYAVRKNKTSSLWAHPTPNQILNLFDREVVEKTIRHFPVTRKFAYDYELPSNIAITNDESIDDGNIKTLLDKLWIDNTYGFEAKDNEAAINEMILKTKYEKVSIVDKDLVHISFNELGDSIYDPCFVFPLLSHLLAPGSVASCFKLMRTGLLSVAVVALSSQCSMMRVAAFHVLHRFCMLLETETKHKNDKIVLTDFVEMLRRTLSSAMSKNHEVEHYQTLKNPRLPAINALYLAKALIISATPGDLLYKPVNNFFIAKQHVDLTVVPDFLSLFHDCDVESSDRRIWLLGIIRDGIKTMTDVNVIFKTMCLKMIMDFYSSVLSDRKTRERILGVMERIVSIPRAFEILVEGYGLIAWLHGIVRLLNKDDKVIFKSILKLIRNVFVSTSVNSFCKSLNTIKNNDKTILDIREIRTDKDLDNDFIFVLYEIGKIVKNLEVTDAVEYLRTLNSAKKNIKLLSKKQLMVLIDNFKCFNKKDDSLKLLARSVATNNADMLKSRLLNISDFDDEYELALCTEIKTLVGLYLL